MPAQRKDKMKTPAQQKEYKKDYYQQLKDYHHQKYRDWCKDNPERAKAIQKRWRDAHPHYYRDYIRKRKAVTEPLIFEFLDNGNFDSDIDDFIVYLRDKAIPGQHIKWFKVDVQKIIGVKEGKRNEERT